MNIETQVSRVKLVHFLFLFLFLSTLVLHSQTQEEWRIQEIRFEGLKRTKATFLRPFVKTQLGSIPVDSILALDVQRLKNISGIGDAGYRMDTVGQDLKLVFWAKELQTLLPIVKYGGIKDNFWFQLGMTDINWLGKGQHLSASYQNTDGRHSGQLYFRNPYLYDSNWGYSIDLLKWSSREPLYFQEGSVNYDYDNNSAGFSIICHLGFKRDIEFGATYFVEKYAKSREQYLETPPGPESLKQEKWMSKFQYKEDFLDYNFFYLKGFSWNLIQQNVLNTIDKTWFHTLQFEGKRFFRLKEKGNLALRLNLAISTNTNTPFAPFVVDSHVNIRGAGNRIDRGTAQVVFNTEYRQTLFESKQWAAQSVVFLDSGTWRNPGGELKDVFNRTHFRQFVGGGFRIIYQKIYGAVFRLDYGIDVFNKEEHGFVLGLGQYF